MDIATQFNSQSIQPSNPYAEYLLHPPEALQGIVPPSLDRLDDVLKTRKDYFAKQGSREAMVAALKESHRRRNAPPSARQSLDALDSENTFLIIAGQQPGLLGGPLFTYYKILQACLLAERLTREREATFLPAFWNAAEDHDFPEIASMHWLSKDKEIETFTWEGGTDSRKPYFALSARDCPLDALIGRIRESTHETEFFDPILQSIREAHGNSVSYPDFIDRLLWMLFPQEGLVILRPDEEYVRRAARPIMQREIKESHRNAESIEQAGTRLRDLGLSPQIHKRPDRTAFFLIRDEQRIPVYASGDAFTTQEEGEYTQAELLDLLEHQPAAFSPSAVLRPVVQDAIFPTAAAILGPGEMAYHFQLNSVYTMHCVPRPCLVPRMGFTLLEKRDRKFLDRYQLTPADLQSHPARLVKQFQRDGDVVEAAQTKEKIEDQLDVFMEGLKEKAGRIDPSIQNVLDKNQKKLLELLDQSQELLARRAGEKDRVLRKQIEGLQAAVFPHNQWQEREFNIVMYVLKYGLDFLRQFKMAVKETPAGEHRFVNIP